MSEQTDVSALIQQLEAERDEMNVTIAFLRRKAGMAAVETNGSGVTAVRASDTGTGRDASIIVGRVRSDEFFRLSISDAIMKYLGIMKQPQNPMAVVNGLKAGGVLTNAKNFYANVNTELKRMKARELVVNTPSGWGLAEWYPNKPKQSDAPKPKKKAKKKRAKDSGPKALKDGSMVGSVKAERSNQAGRPMTYHEFMGEHMRSGKPKTELGTAWREYQAQHGLGE